MHGGKLQRDLAQAVDAQRPTRDGVDPALVFKIRTHSGVDEGKLEESGLKWLGNTKEWTYFVLADQGPGAFKARLDAYTAAGQTRKGAPDLTFFEGIIEVQPYSRKDRQGPGISDEELRAQAELSLDVILWPSANFDSARDRVASVRKVVASHDGQVLAADESPRFTVVRVRASSDCIGELLDLAVVESIRTSPVPHLEPTTWRFADVEDLPEPERREVAAIGLIDDGVMDHPLLEGSVVSRTAIPDDHDWQPPTNHGTLVAGLLVLGDIEAALAGERSWVAIGPVHSVRVLEPDPNDPEDAIFPTDRPVQVVIEEAIRALHDREGVRVFNLSIADRYAFSGPHLSIWSERMDELARELDAVIVVAAGNHSSGDLQGEQALSAYPGYLLEESAGVAEPGAGANVLTVGALARSAAPQRADGSTKPGDRPIAGINEPAPFTRSGPGAGGAIKPDISHYGGNWVLNDANLLERRDHGVSVVSLRAGDGKLFGLANGTSYAAPRVTRVAAEVLARYPDSSANLVRALIAAAAQPVLSPDSLEPKDLRRASGYGRLSDERATDSGRHRVAMIYEGEIDADTAVIHPVPVPAEFVEVSGARRINIALAFDPEVRRTRREYLTANMKMDLVRGLPVEEIEDIWKKQPAKDKGRKDLPASARLRPQLDPGSQECKDATLQVRSYTRQQIDEVDAHGYHVVVQHLTASWFAGIDPQRYALVVVLEDREREGIDLRGLVQARLEDRIRLRARV